jgi:hypothetical protein
MQLSGLIQSEQASLRWIELVVESIRVIELVVESIRVIELVVESIRVIELVVESIQVIELVVESIRVIELVVESLRAIGSAGKSRSLTMQRTAERARSAGTGRNHPTTYGFANLKSHPNAKRNLNRQL